MDIITNQRQAKENTLSSFRNLATISKDGEFAVKVSEANPCSFGILQNSNTSQTLVEYLSEKLHKNSRANKPGHLNSQPNTSLHKKSEICGVLKEPQCAWLSGKQRHAEARIKPLSSSSHSFCEDSYSGFTNKKPQRVYKHLQRNMMTRKSHQQRYALKDGLYGAVRMKRNMNGVNRRPRVYSSSNSDSSVDTCMSSTDELFKVCTRQREPGRYIVGRHFHNLCKNLKFRTSSVKFNHPQVAKNKFRLRDRGVDTADYKNNERLSFVLKPRLTSQRSIGKLSDNERKRGHRWHSLLSRWLAEYGPKKTKRYNGRLESGASTLERSASATPNEEYSCSSSMSSSKPLRTALRNSSRRKRAARKRCVHFDPRIGKHTPASKCKRYDKLMQSEDNKHSSLGSGLQPRSSSKKRNSVLRNVYKEWGLSSSSETLPLIYPPGDGSSEDVLTPLSYRRLQSDDENMK